MEAEDITVEDIMVEDIMADIMEDIMAATTPAIIMAMGHTGDPISIIGDGRFFTPFTGDGLIPTPIIGDGHTPIPPIPIIPIPLLQRLP